ncbi:spermidine synthase [Ideonella sp. YS5]|uniref:spermidine synthase n=1 Tax=Ideonella sp. YS5 TaxID=3453714 RepID=UPI003EF07F89
MNPADIFPTGGLTRFCHTVPGLRTTVVEINPAVIDANRRWFHLPDDARLNVVLDDAAHWVSDPAHAGTAQVISIDVYDHEAAKPVLDTEPFYAACERRQRGPDRPRADVHQAKKHLKLLAVVGLRGLGQVLRGVDVGQLLTCSVQSDFAARGDHYLGRRRHRVIHEAATHRPELFERPDFVDEVVALLEGFFQRPPAGRVAAAKAKPAARRSTRP